jgi:hypothetical protein
MVDIKCLQPMIVPADYVQLNNWDLPHFPLPNPAFLLTWVEFEEGLTYLTRDEYSELELTSLQWQQQTVDNVRQTQWFHQQSKKSESGELEWIAFVNDEDTISSSKVLLQEELKRIFPQGYLIGIPDRACALVVSTQCTGDALTQVQELIAGMHDSATTPMSPLLHSSTDFQIPEAWAVPFANDHTSAAILDLFSV